MLSGLRDEVEKEVMKHPLVYDCACVPMADKIQGQAPKLFIQLEKDADFDDKEFRKFRKLIYPQVFCNDFVGKNIESTTRRNIQVSSFEKIWRLD